MSKGKFVVSPSPKLMQQRAFVLFWLARLSTTMAMQMLTLIIGWQIYAITHSAFDLGLVGLIQFIPTVVLTLLIGHTADRYDRRLIVQAAQGVYALAALVVTTALLVGLPSRDFLFAAVFLIGGAKAFELPTGHSLIPALVPPSLLSRAVAARGSANQVATICGPILGGLIFTVNPVLVSAICVIFFIFSIILVNFIQTKATPAQREPLTFASVLAGFEFIRRRRRLLGVIGLDLFVVLFGGVTALLPIFAKDILAVGPTGLGLLQSAPAVGALFTTILLSRWTVERHIGRKMFGVVAIYGVATIIFGLFTWFPLSLAALLIIGASDAVSVVIRFSLVQIETPDDKRGRVSAINYLFVGSSNTLGEFESGIVASWFGAVASALIGGIGSLIIAGLWTMLFPTLRDLDRFEPAEQKQKES
jgi:MFS family permease